VGGDDGALAALVALAGERHAFLGAGLVDHAGSAGLGAGTP
jgi:hypothetical protein